MPVLPASDFPGAERRPLEYPGLRPAYSFVYFHEQVYPVAIAPDGQLLVEHGAGHAALDDFLRDRASPGLDDRLPVLAVGSNGCPGRLAEKYELQPEAAIPVLLGELANVAVVYAHWLTLYAALPATYVRYPGARSRVAVTMLTADQVSLMDRSERTYQRIPVPGAVAVAPSLQVGELSAYLDRRVLSSGGHPVLLKEFAAGGTTWPALNEREVLTLALDLLGFYPAEPLERRRERLAGNRTLRRDMNRRLAEEMGGRDVDEEGRLRD